MELGPGPLAGDNGLLDLGKERIRPAAMDPASAVHVQMAHYNTHEKLTRRNTAASTRAESSATGTLWRSNSRTLPQNTPRPQPKMRPPPHLRTSPLPPGKGLRTGRQPPWTQSVEAQQPPSDEGQPRVSWLERLFPLSVWVTVVVLITYLLMLITSLTIQRSWEETVDLLTPQDDEKTRTALHWGFSGVLLIVFLVVAVYSSRLQTKQKELAAQEEAELVALDEEQLKEGVNGQRKLPRPRPAKSIRPVAPVGSLNGVAMEFNHMLDNPSSGHMDVNVMEYLQASNPLSGHFTRSHSKQKPLTRTKRKPAGTVRAQKLFRGTSPKRSGRRQPVVNGISGGFTPGSNASVAATRYTLV